MRSALAADHLQGDLAEVDIHEVLSNERRELTLRVLRETDGPLSVKELSERIATLETGEDPAPRNLRQSVYVSLLQSHLPKLDNLNVVEFDEDEKVVTLGPSAHEVFLMMEATPGPTRALPYLFGALVGLVIVGSANIGVQLLNPMIAAALSAILLFGIAVASGYQTAAAGWPSLQQFRTR